MKTIIKVLVLVVTTVVLVACSSTQTHISMTQAKNKALEEVTGEVVMAKENLEASPATYDFKIKTTDKQYFIRVDAADGTILKRQEEVTLPGGEVPSKISSEEANQIAIDKVGGGTVVKNQIEDSDGRLEYDIKVVDKDSTYNLEIDASTGNITFYQEEKQYGNQGDRNTISSEQAKQIALDKVGGGVVTENKLEYDDKIERYEIEIYYNNIEYEIEVDASTGQVIKYEENKGW